jgi:Fe2+ or Zn2+ uptake regulation protein
MVVKRVGSQGEMMAAFEASERRIKPQRRAILDYVAGRSDHPSARQIHRGLPIPPAAIRSGLGFEAVDFRIEYRGLCSRCRAPGATTRGEK